MNYGNKAAGLEAGQDVTVVLCTIQSCFLEGKKRVLGSSRRLFWGTETFPFMFFFGPGVFNVLTAPALAPSPVAAHPSSSVTSRPCWFGEFFSLCLREEVWTDTVRI